MAPYIPYNLLLPFPIQNINAPTILLVNKKRLIDTNIFFNVYIPKYFNHIYLLTQHNFKITNEPG